MTVRAAFVPLLAPLLVGCFDKLTAPPCNPVSFSQASTSGDTTITTTGLKYIDGIEGSGAAVAWCDAVAIHYEGFLLDGTMFDSSRDNETPLVFTPGFGGLIDGIEQGVIGMQVGATRRLVISPSLGFGTEPRRGADGVIIVPGNSTVVYDIEIVLLAQ